MKFDDGERQTYVAAVNKLSFKGKWYTLNRSIFCITYFVMLSYFVNKIHFETKVEKSYTFNTCINWTFKIGYDDSHHPSYFKMPSEATLVCVYSLHLSHWQKWKRWTYSVCEAVETHRWKKLNSYNFIAGDIAIFNTTTYTFIIWLRNIVVRNFSLRYSL